MKICMYLFVQDKLECWEEFNEEWRGQKIHRNAKPVLGLRLDIQIGGVELKRLVC
jgi:hypothetical protein